MSLDISRPPSSVNPSPTLFNIFSSDRKHCANWNQISFGVSMGWGKESLFKRFWSHDKMATMLIYGENLKKSSSLVTLKLGMQQWALEYYQVCSNDDPGLTLTYFTAMSNLVPYAFLWEKGKTMDFSETIVIYDLKLAIDDWSDKKFMLTSKLCPLGAVCPLLRGYIHVINHEKNCIKSDFKEISLKLATDG